VRRSQHRACDGVAKRHVRRAAGANQLSRWRVDLVTGMSQIFHEVATPLKNNFNGLPTMENKGFAMAQEREELKRKGLIKDDDD